MAENAVRERSVAFAKRVVKLYRYLKEEKREHVMSDQLLRSGTSIGANIAEALCAISKKEFLHKMQISFKECTESLFWLELLQSDNYISEREYESLRYDCEEIRKLLAAITKSTKISILNS